MAAVFSKRNNGLAYMEFFNASQSYLFVYGVHFFEGKAHLTTEEWLEKG